MTTGRINQIAFRLLCEQAQIRAFGNPPVFPPTAQPPKREGRPARARGVGRADLGGRTRILKKTQAQTPSRMVCVFFEETISRARERSFLWIKFAFRCGSLEAHAFPAERGRASDPSTFGGGPFAVSMVRRSVDRACPVSVQKLWLSKCSHPARKGRGFHFVSRFRRRGDSRIAARSLRSLLAPVMCPAIEGHCTGPEVLRGSCCVSYGLVHIV
jgi:hypothetical protein